MRKLVLLIGSPGAGKSTWVKDNNLEQYTISPDNIRLLFQSPVLDDSGNEVITNKHDKPVWELLYKLLEARMERGEFTVIDATHSTTSAFTAYKVLADKYRYRVYGVSFRNIPIETAKERNNSRPLYKRVPEDVIDTQYARYSAYAIPNWVTTYEPEEAFNKIINTEPVDYTDKYKRIHVVGDIHGTIAPLRDFLATVNHEEDLIIFTGDYFDRGINNAEVFRALEKLKSDHPSTIFLSGNHEVWLLRHASNDLESCAGHYRYHTAVQFEQAGIKRADVSRFTKHLSQISYFVFNNQRFLVNHGGITNMPLYLDLVATDQFVRGVGKYELDVDRVWNENQNKSSNPIIQIHGHRNIFSHSTRVNPTSFNLEGKVEFGGSLRTVCIEQEGISVRSFDSTISTSSTSTTASVQVPKVDALTVESLFTHKGIRAQRSVTYPHITSFNFKHHVFSSGNWDSMTVKARGLMINTQTSAVAMRGYEKFFNLNERNETRLHNVLQFDLPVQVYDKPNGFLGLLSYDHSTDDLVYATKAGPDTSYALLFKSIIQKDKELEQQLREYLKTQSCTLTFEVIDPIEDPHIIKYTEDAHVVLLDQIDNTLDFCKLPYTELRKLAEVLRVRVKEHVNTLETREALEQFLLNVENNREEIEGYVLESSSGQYVKIKLDYYLFWKRMRGMVQALKACKPTNKFTFDARGANFLTFLKTLPKEDLELSIIALRDKYETTKSS